MKPEWVMALAAVAGVIVSGVYAYFTWGLWAQARRQAEIAAGQVELTRRMLEASQRPRLSLDLYADAGTGPNGINVAAVLRNSGPVPATVTGASLRATFGEDVLGEGQQLTPRHVPSQLCIFPGRGDELTWGILNPFGSSRDGFIRIESEVTYQGVLDQTHMTRVLASYPRPEAALSQRAPEPMQVVRMDTT